MQKIALFAALALASIPTIATAMPEKDAEPVAKSTAAGVMRVGATVTNAQIIADTLKAASAQKAEARTAAAKSSNLRVIEAAPAAAHNTVAGKAAADSSNSVSIKVSVKPNPAEAEDAIDEAVAAAASSAAVPEADADHANETWGDLEETERYLLIMGNADGFSALGAGAPCFPGKNNADLNNELIALEFEQERADTLTETLATLSADPTSCGGSPMRGYSIDLLKSMPDAHIATYLTGLVRAYSFTDRCPAEHHQYAAATVTAAIFSATPGAQPVPVIKEALEKGCQGVQASAEHSS